MCLFRICVNRNCYVVTRDELRTWKTSVVDAIRHGGGFVDLTNTAGVETAMLITAHSVIAVQEASPEVRQDPIDFGDLSFVEDL